MAREAAQPLRRDVAPWHDTSDVSSTPSENNGQPPRQRGNAAAAQKINKGTSAGAAMKGTVRFAAGTGIPMALYFSFLGLCIKWVVKQIDPNKDAKRLGKLRGERLSKRLGRHIELQDLEQVVAQDLIFPEHMDVTLEQIGGLDHLTDVLNAKVMMPLKRPDLFRGKLLRLEKGILLYGPPGTGKTLLAKALARESGAAFINVSAASLQSKWFGETSRLVSALFKLAWKCAPTIIFIDEVDALLGRRKESDHEATVAMKTEIMQMWDGLLSTSESAQVLVLGATNRPEELDAAVLRRFSLQLEVPMPGARQREAILEIMLRQHMADVGTAQIEPQLAANVAPSPSESRPLQAIAEKAVGLSGSDLLQLCSHAAALPVLELARSQDASPLAWPRPLAVADFFSALDAGALRKPKPQPQPRPDPRELAAEYIRTHLPMGGGLN